MEPPRPLTTHWLTSYTELQVPTPAWILEDPLPPTEGGPSGLCSELRWSDSSASEATHLLRRAGPFSSKLLCAESHSVEREYRFHRELASLLAGPSSLLRPEVAPPDPDPLNELVAELQHEPDREAIFQVVHTRVVVRDLPKLTLSTQLITLRKGHKVRGTLKEFGGQAWVEVSRYGKEQLGLDRERPAYAQMNGAATGLGELLRRTNEAPLPEPDHWRRQRTAAKLPLPTLPGVPDSVPRRDVVTPDSRPMSAKSPKGSDTTETDSEEEAAAMVAQEGFMMAHHKWTHLYERLLDRSAEREGRWLVLVRRMLEGRQLRVPRCFASYWASKGGDEAWRSFLLVLERLGEPEWQAVDPAMGCSDLQARSAVESIGATHREFKGRRLLNAHAWLPLTPLDLANPQIVQKQFSACMQGLLESGLLQSSVSPVVLEACEKLCHIEAYGPEALGRLIKPPLTLLHGDFHPGLRPTAQAWTGLRFSSTEMPAVAALDWQSVSRGRGAYDLATFMALSIDVDARRDWEPWMLMLYGEAAGGRGGVAARAEFDDDIRAGYFATLVFFLLRNAGTLGGSGQVDPAMRSATLLGLSRLGAAIEDWDAMKVLGGSELARQRAEDEERRRRDERTAARKARPKKKWEGEKLSAVDKLRRKSQSPNKKGTGRQTASQKGKSQRPASGSPKRPVSGKSKSPSRPASSQKR